MNKNEYIIRAEIRDAEGRLIWASKNNMVSNLCLEPVRIDVDENQSERLERILTQTFEQMTALMPDRIINVTAQIHNERTQTLPAVASFYGKEKRFVYHT